MSYSRIIRDIEGGINEVQSDLKVFFDTHPIVKLFNGCDFLRSYEPSCEDLFVIASGITSQKQWDDLHGAILRRSPYSFPSWPLKIALNARRGDVVKVLLQLHHPLHFSSSQWTRGNLLTEIIETFGRDFLTLHQLVGHSRSLFNCGFPKLLWFVEGNRKDATLLILELMDQTECYIESTSFALILHARFYFSSSFIFQKKLIKIVWKSNPRFNLFYHFLMYGFFQIEEQETFDHLKKFSIPAPNFKRQFELRRFFIRELSFVDTLIQSGCLIDE
jgi:hypothetical protein